MQIGMVGLGRMGANLVRRLMAGGHDCVVFDLNPDGRRDPDQGGSGQGPGRSRSLCHCLTAPRVVWIMIPAAFVDSTIASLRPHLSSGDIVIDGGNSFFEHDIQSRPRPGRRRDHLLWTSEPAAVSTDSSGDSV